MEKLSLTEAWKMRYIDLANYVETDNADWAMCVVNSLGEVVLPRFDVRTLFEVR